jgi:glutamate 5-kinase
MAGGAGSSIGRGGMLTKVLAAKRAAGSGASTVIAWGREPDVLLRLAAGEAIGTALVAGTPKLAARKQWMVDHLQLRGASSSTPARCSSCATKARACCRSA